MHKKIENKLFRTEFKLSQNIHLISMNLKKAAIEIC